MSEHHDPQQHPEPGDDRLLGHAYDGIQEYDNPMPRWWLWGFYATIIFSVIYFADPRQTFAGEGRVAEYDAEMRAYLAAHPPAPAGGGADEAAILAAAQDAKAVQAGGEVFAKNCAACHRADGGGLIGPNLTDAFWLHGGTPAAIYRTIDAGVLQKGMPAWGKMLKPEEVLGVTAYVTAMQATPAKDGKAPEGMRFSDAGATPPAGVTP
ncbi:MAG: cbb3-type cytochrome c oxidase N-terminal domain-containing protein [Gemmatimonadales bacterium]|nr:cbb3-type cytochrome c oxidase N-terminal domain-containing protein [Gemmatimonadales bacterium]